MNIKKLLIIIIIATVILWIVLPTKNCNNNEYLTVCDGSTCSDVQNYTVAQESNVEKAYTENKGKVTTDKIVDQRVESASLLNAQCSADCCDKQWPPPFTLTPDTNVDTTNIVPSGYMCNNSWNNTGCLCMTKNMSNILKNRGIVS